MGMKTTTTPEGRDPKLHGFPLRFTEMAGMLEGVCYTSRQAVNSPANVRRAKKALRKAIGNSMEGRGTSVVEFISICPSGWKMIPREANKWLEDTMLQYYPLSKK
jgi:2-oxoglutarate ferredoxin oxidoreductase subunit beta